MQKSKRNFSVRVRTANVTNSVIMAAMSCWSWMISHTAVWKVTKCAVENYWLWEWLFDFTMNSNCTSGVVLLGKPSNAISRPSYFPHTSTFSEFEVSSFNWRICRVREWHFLICCAVFVKTQSRWHGGAKGKAFGLAINRSQVQILLEVMPRSRSSITWYRPKGGDALRLGR